MKTPAPGLFRKLLFSLMLAGILASLMELGSFTTLWILTGEAFTPARAAVERERVLQQVEALSNQRALESELERSERPAIVPEDQGNLAPEVMHPFLGYVRDPNFEDPLFAMNPLGLYASRPALPTGEAARGEPGEADLVSVGIFGGSVAVGLARAPSLVAELRRSPALAGKRLWIRIFALGGYKQPQQLIALNYALALGEKLDIVINLDGFNDIALAPAPHRSAGLATHFPSRWHLFASSIRSVEIQRLVGEIHAEGNDATGRMLDATAEGAIEALVAEVEADIGPIDTIIFNLGAQVGDRPLAATTPKIFELGWRMATFGLFRVAQAAFPAMVERGRGNLIATSATAAFRGNRGQHSHAAAMGGRRLLCQTLNAEFGPQG
ncbi:MAG: SDR family NAD(P)-dependent oxidoreductase, partial [Acidobacteriota bacterium]